MYCVGFGESVRLIHHKRKNKIKLVVLAYGNISYLSEDCKLNEKKNESFEHVTKFCVQLFVLYHSYCRWSCWLCYLNQKKYQWPNAIVNLPVNGIRLNLQNFAMEGLIDTPKIHILFFFLIFWPHFWVRDREGGV